MPEPSSGLPFVCFVVGAVVCLGGWLAATAVLMKYGLHRSAGFGAAVQRLMGEDAAPDRRRLLVRGAVAGLGAVALLLGILMGDHARHAPCRDACVASGYGSGRLRASPHAPRAERGPGPRACWCHNGEDWAPEALELLPAQSAP